jgi:hypothetical protein
VVVAVDLWINQILQQELQLLDLLVLLVVEVEQDFVNQVLGEPEALVVTVDPDLMLLTLGCLVVEEVVLLLVEEMLDHTLSVVMVERVQDCPIYLLL